MFIVSVYFFSCSATHGPLFPSSQQLTLTEHHLFLSLNKHPLVMVFVWIPYLHSEVLSIIREHVPTGSKTLNYRNHTQLSQLLYGSCKLYCKNMLQFSLNKQNRLQEIIPQLALTLVTQFVWILMSTSISWNSTPRPLKVSHQLKCLAFYICQLAAG